MLIEEEVCDLYIRVLSNKFFLKSVVFLRLISNEINHPPPPPPINALVADVVDSVLFLYDFYVFCPVCLPYLIYILDNFNLFKSI